jgi:hypothetical protein
MKVINIRTVLFFGSLILSGLSLNLQADDTDIMFIMDTSGSMNEKIHTGGNRYEYARKKMEAQLNKYLEISEVNVGVMTFMNNAPFVARELTPFKNASEIQTILELTDQSYSSNNGTPLVQTIRSSKQYFLSSAAKHQYLVILTDGNDSNSGIQGMRQVISEMNSELEKVQIHLFIIDPNPNLLSQYNEIKGVINHGILFVIQSNNSNADAYFELTFNSIHGKFKSSQIRKSLKEMKRLGKIHADEVHVLSNIGQYTKPQLKDKEKVPMLTMDWDALKADDPELYQDYVTRLEMLEQEFLTTKSLLSFNNLLGVYQNDPSLISKWMNAVWYKNDDSMSSYYVDNLSGTLVSPMADLMNYSESFAFRHPDFTKHDQISSGKSSRSISGTVSATAGFAIPFMILDNFTDNKPSRKALKGAASAGSVLSYTGSLIVQSSRVGGEIDRQREERDQEVDAFNKLIETGRLRKALKVIFSNLSDAQIQLKIEAIQKSTTFEEYTQALFGHDKGLATYTDFLNTMNQHVQNIAAGKSPQQDTSGIRGTNLPVHIEAHLTALLSEIESNIKQSYNFSDHIEKDDDLSQLILNSRNTHQVQFKIFKENINDYLRDIK